MGDPPGNREKLDSRSTNVFFASFGQYYKFEFFKLIFGSPVRNLDKNICVHCQVLPLPLLKSNLIVVLHSCSIANPACFFLGVSHHLASFCCTVYTKFSVVNFDKRLGAAHYKCLAKPPFFMLFQAFSKDFNSKMTNKEGKNMHFGTYFCINVLLNIQKHEKEISTSIWSAQHPNAGQNIQHFSHIRETFNKQILVLISY